MEAHLIVLVLSIFPETTHLHIEVLVDWDLSQEYVLDGEWPVACIMVSGWQVSHSIDLEGHQVLVQAVIRAIREIVQEGVVLAAQLYF